VDPLHALVAVGGAVGQRVADADTITALPGPGARVGPGTRVIAARAAAPPAQDEGG
jgi:hypothetical protein